MNDHHWHEKIERKKTCSVVSINTEFRQFLNDCWWHLNSIHLREIKAFSTFAPPESTCSQEISSHTDQANQTSSSIFCMMMFITFMPKFVNFPASLCASQFDIINLIASCSFHLKKHEMTGWHHFFELAAQASCCLCLSVTKTEKKARVWLHEKPSPVFKKHWKQFFASRQLKKQSDFDEILWHDPESMEEHSLGFFWQENVSCCWNWSAMMPPC